MLVRTQKIQTIHTLLRTGDNRRLKRALERLDDVQIASQLDNLQVEDQILVLQRVPAVRRAPILAVMRYEAAALLVERLAPQEAARLLDDLDPDDVVDILGEIDEEQLEQILASLDKEDVDELEELLAYDENSAAGIMSPEAFRTRPEATVADTIRAIQSAEDLPDRVFDVYVVDREDRLRGVCSLRALVTSPATLSIQEVMETDVISVRFDTDQEDVAEVVSRYDLLAVPVVDEHNRLLGMVEVDDIVDVIREEATEDFLKMAGAGEQLVEARSFVSSFRARWRWLMAAAFGGILAALTLSRFENALGTVPALAFFMPVVAGMGGNVGTQSSTIVVRGLAVGFVEASRLRHLVVREVGLGASLGLIYGLLIASVSPWFGAPTTDPLSLGAVVGLGMAGSMTIAAAVGTCVPLFLDRANVDPAVATGPFVTTAVDVMGLLFYFWLATVLLGVSA
jgi:magnesium transporter